MPTSEETLVKGVEDMEQSVKDMREMDYAFLKSMRGANLEGMMNPTLEEIASMRSPLDKFIDDYCEREFNHDRTSREDSSSEGG